MRINSTKQLKDWISNYSKQNSLESNTVLQTYMMERFLERVAKSKYKDNFIIKGGFLIVIAAMVGIDMRSTMDIDTTIKGVHTDQYEIEKIVNEILLEDVDDNITFTMKSIKSIHKAGKYNDFRIGIEAQFLTIRVTIKIDITTGDVIIPKEIDYSYKLLFEDREIMIKAYNIYTILAEKIESIIVRNVSNTRSRDFYDIYVLSKTESFKINKQDLKVAVYRKAKERNTIEYIDNYLKYITDISESQDIQKVWDSYKEKYSYARNIDLNDILEYLKKVLQ
ncbi:MAG: hypothetical protein BWX97_00977 [Firmicutes bacterium ADurb.Bin146]|nr:MAG: hypothetical protein BWX97_00977 [Firmicutes bacterium ADurb.Bin146]